MMKTTRIRILAILLTALGAAGLCDISLAADYSTLAQRASRFYDHEEWASASALFDLMLDQRPGEVDVYGRAIVARAIMSDTTAQLSLLDHALDNHLPFDSVFSAVRTSSFELGKTHIYERFLHLVGATHPWLRRTIDGYLLRYYSFRRNGPMMVEYSDKMLAGAPNNVYFLNQRAQGYLQMGEYDRAVDSYMAMLTYDPSNLDALLALGNYYAMLSGADPAKAQLARTYLSAAYAIKPTPYVETLLRTLQ